MSGFDVALYYSFNNTLGNFNLAFNIAKLEKFKQKAGNDFVKLIEAQEYGIIPNELAITGFSDLLEKDGSPEIQASFKFLWNQKTKFLPFTQIFYIFFDNINCLFSSTNR